MKLSNEQLIMQQHEATIRKQIMEQEARDNLVLDAIHSSNPYFKERFLNLHSDCQWRELEIVEKPHGDEQDANYWVDQYQSGEDSFSGHAYTRISGNKWLKCYFEM